MEEFSSNMYQEKEKNKRTFTNLILMMKPQPTILIYNQYYNLSPFLIIYKLGIGESI